MSHVAQAFGERFSGIDVVVYDEHRAHLGLSGCKQSNLLSENEPIGPNARSEVRTGEPQSLGQPRTPCSRPTKMMRQRVARLHVARALAGDGRNAVGGPLARGSIPICQRLSYCFVSLLASVGETNTKPSWLP